MKTLFNQLFDYNFYANKQVIEHCGALEKVPQKSIELFSHILNAHHIWNHRIMGEPIKLEVWQKHTLSDWEELHYENQRTTFEIVTNTEDFELSIDYENTEGRRLTNQLKDVLFHIINHSTHHRAQVVMDFRQHDINPKKLDYIFYKR